MDVLVLGNPGVGKTYNLVKTIKKFIEDGYSPHDITVLSHTRVAAKEIAKRAGASGANASTVHSLAYRLAEIDKSQVVSFKELKEFSESIGVPLKGSSGDNDEFIGMGDEYLATIGYSEACCIPVQWAYKDKGMPGSLSDFEFFYHNYISWKKAYGLIDFDDMLDLAIKSEIKEKFPVLLIDEAQDLSNKQWMLIEKISKNTKEMVVTGDPDQALFVWGGAYPQGMMDWAGSKKASIVELTQSYRVPIEAYKLSRSIIRGVKDRYEKDYKPTDTVGNIDTYLSVCHFDFSTIGPALILYRNHVLRRSVEEELIRNNIAYTTLNGFPGMCGSKYGRGVKAWLDMRNSKVITESDINKLKVIATVKMQKAIWSEDVDAILSMSAEEALNIPYEYLSYYRNIDFSKSGDVLLSTIHGAKGMEHNNVILINGITQRVMDEAMANSDAEHHVWFVAVTRTSDKLTIIDGEGVHGPL